MSNKKIIKQIFEKQFNKDDNYVEIINKVDNNSKHKKYNVFKYSIVSLGLVTIAFTIVLALNNSRVSMENNINNYEVNTRFKNKIVINEISNKVSGALKLDTDIKIIRTADVFKMYSLTNNLIVPDGMVLDSYCLYVKDYNGNSKEEYMQIKEYGKLYDCRLRYESNNSNIEIAIAKDHAPLRDYVFEDNNLKISKINNIDITIIKYENYYWITFNNKNIYYDIETTNIDISVVEMLLESILQ